MYSLFCIYLNFFHNKKLKNRKGVDINEYYLGSKYRKPGNQPFLLFSAALSEALGMQR